MTGIIALERFLTSKFKLVRRLRRGEKPMKTVHPSGWRSREGREAYLAAYDSAMGLWPVPFESRQVATRFGSTHVVVSGSPELSPLVLLHAATGFGATQWYPNAGGISQRHRIFAVDFIGSAGKGVQTQPLLTRADCGSWLTDVIDGLDLDCPDLVGSSQGGWLALNLALLHPERAGALALLAPAGSIVPIRPLMRLFIKLGPMMPAWTGRPSLNALLGGRAQVDGRIVRLLTLHLKHFRYQQMAVFPSAFPEDELRRLEFPTLILIGKHEKIYHAESTLRKAARVLPNAKAELVDDAGHLMNLECPRFVDERLLRFLSDYSAGSRRPGTREPPAAEVLPVSGVENVRAI